MNYVSIGILLLFALPLAVSAEPFRPSADEQVLERLPAAADRNWGPLRTARRALARDPENLALAVTVAEQALKLGRVEGDPRWLGFAEGALGPWWGLADPPEEVLLLRARIRQNAHAFAAALADLDALVRAEPSNARAWLARAATLRVLGRYAEAQRSCAPLIDLTDPLTAATCMAEVASLMGHAEPSLRLLQEELRRTPDASPEQAAWSLGVVADIATALGRDEIADEAYRRALATAGGDRYLLAKYADFLLDRGRPGAVADLLTERADTDGLLLRLALAQQSLGSPELPELTERLGRALRRRPPPRPRAAPGR